jgi:hypothetical protein
MENPAASAGAASQAVRFTIGTLVTDVSHYEAMCASFRAHGFDGPDCEYLKTVPPAGRRPCAYRALNHMLGAARGTYVILCHQDVRLVDHGRAELDARLAELDHIDPDWALAGNAGGVAPGQLAIRITDRNGGSRCVGPFPARVMSLDENLLVVRRSARIGLSHDLSGLHFYGTDLCLVADILGYSAYVIDFHLQHLSKGLRGAAFSESEATFCAKWSVALRPRWIQTPSALVHVGGNGMQHWLGSLAKRPYGALSRRLPSARTWSGAAKP